MFTIVYLPRLSPPGQPTTPHVSFHLPVLESHGVMGQSDGWFHPSLGGPTWYHTNPPLPKPIGPWNAVRKHQWSRRDGDGRGVWAPAPPPGWQTSPGRAKRRPKARRRNRALRSLRPGGAFLVAVQRFVGCMRSSPLSRENEVSC